jgi:hypothetical protein
MDISLALQMDGLQTRPAPVRSLSLGRCVVMLGLGVLFWSLLSDSAVAQQLQLSHEALQQIQALRDEKATRTPAQQKIDSNLLLEMKMRRGEAIMQAVPALQTGITLDAKGHTLVDITAEVTQDILDAIVALGGTVVSSFAQYRAIRARMPLEQLETLARLPHVHAIRPEEKAMTHVVNVSQGDVAHRANVARARFGVDGTDVRICALSDSVDFLAQVQATGDLPAVTVLAGQAGTGRGEGTAMLEIVHDLAPGATLGFATANGGQAQFAQNIVDLRNILGCHVIVDDVFYLAEPVFQDGIIAQAVNTVVDSGALYFSSAGNSGNLDDNTSGVWQGDFVPANTVPGLGLTHNFGGTNVNRITAPTSAITLQWSDPFGSSGNDYDLYLLNPSLTQVVAFSTSNQNGSDDPFEGFILEFNPVGYGLVIVKFAGADRFLHLNTHRGRLALATAGQTSGHSAAVGAISVAAVDVARAGGGAFTGGAANPVETFSSDGPRRIFFNADGTPITPDNFSSTGGTVRQKPDIAAADGVATATPGFNPFFGTSAAAPHAAAIGGLLLSASPALTSAQVRDVLTSTALDIEAAGVDHDSGFGIVDAFTALRQTRNVTQLFGNFELVVPLAAGGLAHFYRPNDPIGAWTGPTAIFGNGTYEAVTFIQSGLGPANNNFEVIARQGDQLVSFYRDGTTFRWQGPFGLTSGVTGTPVLIQGPYGIPGDFELVVPLAAGGLAHFYRLNNPIGAWTGPTAIFGSGTYEAVTFIQSDLGPTNDNFEVIARQGDQLVSFYRDGTTFRWQGPFGLTMGVTGTPVLIQSN